MILILILVLPQDPSYQFKDIKQLIMGMLETYNYEEVSISVSYLYCIDRFHNYQIFCMYVQTLLKTTNHILIHDVKGSLAHLHSLVQRGVSPNNHLCIICSRRADSLADGSKDDVVVFT